MVVNFRHYHMNVEAKNEILNWLCYALIIYIVVHTTGSAFVSFARPEATVITVSNLPFGNDVKRSILKSLVSNVMNFTFWIKLIYGNFTHIALYQFQMPLEGEVLKFLIFLSVLIAKSRGKKFEIPIWPLELPSQPAQPIWPNPALVALIGCAVWLVFPKAIVGCQKFFSIYVRADQNIEK